MSHVHKDRVAFDKGFLGCFRGGLGLQKHHEPKGSMYPNSIYICLKVVPI